MLSSGVLGEQPACASCPAPRARHPGQPGSPLAPSAAPPVTAGVLTASVLPRRLVRRGAAAEVTGDGPDIRQHRVQVLQLQRPPAVSALPPCQPPGGCSWLKPQSLSWDILGGSSLREGVFGLFSRCGCSVPPMQGEPTAPCPRCAPPSGRSSPRLARRRRNEPDKTLTCWCPQAAPSCNCERGCASVGEGRKGMGKWAARSPSTAAGLGLGSRSRSCLVCSPQHTQLFLSI